MRTQIGIIIGAIVLLAVLVFGISFKVDDIEVDVVTLGDISANGANNAASDTTTCADNMSWSIGDTTALSANDTTYVTYSGPSFDNGDTSDGLLATSFGFSIPAGTIDGITVAAINWSTGGATYGDVQLSLSGSRIGNDKENGTVSIPTSDPGSSADGWGSGSDTWGATLTPTDVNDSTFGVEFCYVSSSNNNDATIDLVNMTVTYTPTGGAQTTQTQTAYFID